VITKIADIKQLLAKARRSPVAAFPELRQFAASNQWQTREVAATALVELSKIFPAVVLVEMKVWASDPNPNIRRAASEGLRGLVKRDPSGVRPILDRLKADPSGYVQKSVANVLRNASTKHADFVLAVCREWAQTGDPRTRSIIIGGLRKVKLHRTQEAEAILRLCSPSA